MGQNLHEFNSPLRIQPLRIQALRKKDCNLFENTIKFDNLIILMFRGRSAGPPGLASYQTYTLH